MLLTAIPLGLLIGLALGALGGGGSILTVPALVYVLGQEPDDAITSSLIIVGLTAVIAVIPHARAHRVRFGAGLLFGALGTAGSFAGSALSRAVPSTTLLVAFAGLMLLVATLMLRRALRPATPGQPLDPTTEPMLTLRPFSCACPRVAKVVVTATAVGLVTGFLVVLAALVLALGFPMPTAVGTSLPVIAVNSATALTARLGHGGADLDWPLIATFTVAAIAGSLVGGRVAGAVDPRRLTIAFALLLIVVALYTAARSLGVIG